MKRLTSGPNEWFLTVKYLIFHGKVEENLNFKKILIKHWLNNVFGKGNIDFDKKLSCM